MIGRTFPRGGGHIPHRKGATDRKPIVEMGAPAKVVIPLHQHIGAPCEPLVVVGDRVRMGQKVGESKQFVSAPVHASVSGRVEAIEPRVLLDGRKTPSVVIVNDGQDESVVGKTYEKLEQISPKEIIASVKDAGLVGMGGAGFPTHVKLTVPKPVNTVIINGAECEPYLTCDHRLMVERGEELVFGLRAIMKAVGASEGVLGIEVNKGDAIDVIGEIIKVDPRLRLVPLQVRYPQGGEKQLIKAVTGLEVPSGELPFEVACLVSNVHTAISISDAILNGVSLYQRVVTVAGRCVHDPRNVMVRLGTPLRNVIDFCGGMNGTPAVIVGGGPMTGPAVSSLEGPVVKNLSGILLLGEDEIGTDRDEPCIRCGRCVDVCPMGLTPNSLGFYSSQEMLEKVGRLNIMDCMECGLCSYVCPSRRSLVCWIKQGKQGFVARQKAQ